MKNITYKGFNQYHIFGVKSAAGFTLIELLVVVSIIGLLSSVVLYSLNGARTKARDAKRLADIRQIAKAFEVYYNECNSYPPRLPLKLTPAHILSMGTGTNCLGGGFGAAGTAIVTGFPKAPTPADGNVCSATRDLDAGQTNVANNEYVYESVDASGAVSTVTPLPSFNLYFCLGSTTNGVTGNVLHRITPSGIY